MKLIKLEQLDKYDEGSIPQTFNPTYGLVKYANVVRIGTDHLINSVNNIEQRVIQLTLDIESQLLQKARRILCYYYD